jgi:hypothetical protein
MLHSRHPLFLNLKNVLSNVFEENGMHVSCTISFFSPRRSLRFRGNAIEVILVLRYVNREQVGCH